MVCKNCNTENPDTAKFCNHCGEKLVLLGKSCPNPECLRSGLPVEALFCPNCGTKVNAVASPFFLSNENSERNNQNFNIQQKVSSLLSEGARLIRIENILSFEKDKSDIEKPFLMPIEDIFVIDRRGTIVTGKIKNGRIRQGDKIQVVGYGANNYLLTCAGIEKDKKIGNEAKCGDSVGVFFNVHDHDIKRGQVLAKPGSIQESHILIADTYFLSESNGGIGEPLLLKELQFWFRTIEINGVIQFIDNEDVIKPDSVIRLKISLRNPIAMNVGLRFAIRISQKTIGAGIVLNIL